MQRVYWWKFQPMFRRKDIRLILIFHRMGIAGSSDFETKVSFYNFTEVGQDKNTLVGGKSFGNKMIADVEFVSDDEVLVAHEKGYSIFGQMKQPEVVTEKTFSDSISSDQHIFRPPPGRSRLHTVLVCRKTLFYNNTHTSARYSI